MNSFELLRPFLDFFDFLDFLGDLDRLLEVDRLLLEDLLRRSDRDRYRDRPDISGTGQNLQPEIRASPPQPS
jgi:hypothetical protein